MRDLPIMKKTIRTLYNYSKFERQKMVDMGGKHEIKKKKDSSN